MKFSIFIISSLLLLVAGGCVTASTQENSVCVQDLGKNIEFFREKFIELQGLDNSKTCYQIAEQIRDYFDHLPSRCEKVSVPVNNDTVQDFLMMTDLPELVKWSKVSSLPYSWVQESLISRGSAMAFGKCRNIARAKEMRCETLINDLEARIMRTCSKATSNASLQACILATRDSMPNHFGSPNDSANCTSELDDLFITMRNYTKNCKINFPESIEKCVRSFPTS